MGTVIFSLYCALLHRLHQGLKLGGYQPGEGKGYYEVQRSAAPESLTRINIFAAEKHLWKDARAVLQDSRPLWQKRQGKVHTGSKTCACISSCILNFFLFFFLIMPMKMSLWESISELLTSVFLVPQN